MTELLSEAIAGRPGARHWAPPRAPLAASVDADLAAQFEARVAAMFALIDAALLEPVPGKAAVEAVRHALHQLAGTAAFFGQAALGAVASTLNERMRVSGDGATPAFLRTVETTLRDALVGEH